MGRPICCDAPMRGIVRGEARQTPRWNVILTPSRADQRKWTELLDPAIEMMRDLERRLGVPLEFSVGGGTILMRRFRHRISRDLDLFVRDASLIRALSPQLNDFTGKRFAQYVESSSAIKFVLGDQEIDVIVAPALSRRPYVRRRIEGRILNVEEPSEIVAKKLLYRGRLFTHRDLFDLAVVADQAPEELTGMPEIVGRAGLTAVAIRLRELEPRFAEDIALHVAALPSGRRYLKTALGLASRVVAAWIDEAPAAR
jgi:hypothetical protein